MTAIYIVSFIWGIGVPLVGALTFVYADRHYDPEQFQRYSRQTYVLLAAGIVVISWTIAAVLISLMIWMSMGGLLPLVQQVSKIMIGEPWR